MFTPSVLQGMVMAKRFIDSIGVAGVAISVCILLCITLLPSRVKCQDMEREAEIFNWFPQASYHYLSQRNFAAMEKNSIYPIFCETFHADGSLTRYDPLPQPLREGIEQAVACKLMRIKKVKSRIEEDRPEWINAMRARHAGDRLMAYRYTLLDPLIDICLKDGLLEDTGLALLKRPVYKLKSALKRSGYKFESTTEGDEYFAYAAFDQTLLVAGEFANLAAMVDAGSGKEMNLLEDADLLELRELLAELGESWSCAVPVSANREMLERFKETDAPSDFLEKIEGIVEHGLQLKIESWEFGGKNLQFRTIYVYGDEEGAKKEYSEWDTGIPSLADTPGEVVAYNEKLSAATKVSREGNIIIEIATFKPELLEAKLAGIKAWERFRAEIEEKEKSEKDPPRL